MRIFSLTYLLLAVCCNAAEQKEDILSFQNGDQLHGTFSGIADDASLLWSRGDIGEAVKFKSSEVRRIALRGGLPLKSLANLSHIGTSNGDRIPGKIREIDGTRVVIDTEFGGTLEFPRDQVGLLAPNPLGGRILYHGPFSADEWEMIDREHPDGIPAAPKKGEKDDGIPRWSHSGSAWFWRSKDTGTALVRKSGMPDRAILQFEMAWKSRLSMAIAFHSDFKKPAAVKEDDDGERRVGMINGAQAVSLPNLFGNCYALHLYSNYVMLYRTSFDNDGRQRLDRVQSMNGNLRLGDSGKASVEIRCNRLSGEISLYINGDFVAQWSELNGVAGNAIGYAGKGDGFGFVAQSEDAAAKISDVIVAEWNGMPDSARSMQVDDSDIVLLANGTDRFSGKVTGLQDGLLKLDSKFGKFEFPIDEVAEVRFAKSKLAELPKDSADRVRLRLHPLGRISGKALGGDAHTLRIGATPAGEINVNLDSAVIIEFHESGSFSDNWDDEL